jgi:phosphoribosylformylglycinamidine synthase
VARVIVDVVLKPELLDPQGQAIAGALARLGVSDVRDVRQGKHFELDVADDLDEATISKVAETVLANPVIENFAIRWEGEPAEPESTPR